MTKEKQAADSSSFFPAIIPRALRHFFWDILHLINIERESTFPNPGELYKSIIQHGGQQLCLSGVTRAELQDFDREEGFLVASKSATLEEGLS